MRDRIQNALLEGRRGAGRLPSVRELARKLQASPQTVQKAIADLASRGILHALPRKGIFWGAPSDPEPGDLVRLPHWMQARERMLADIRQGAFHPHRQFPSRKELAGIYGISHHRLSDIVEEFVSIGVLRRSGRSLELPPPLARPSQATVVVVIRCDPGGRILLDTEREMDFVKSLRREAAERDVRVSVVGYHESGSGATFLDPRGREVRLADSSGVLIGCVVSTWLVRDPVAMIRSLQSAKVPIAAWWEHPRDLFPKRSPTGCPLAGFDLSFGKSPGIEVGRRLLAEGIRKAVYLSPYHANEWSRLRLAGLREAMEAEGGTVTDYVDERFHSPWHLEKHSGGPSHGKRLLERWFWSFLDDPGSHRDQAWVVVNDAATVVLLELATRRQVQVPRLISFDGSSQSETSRFDSFEFHTDGMVRRMFHHILHRQPRPVSIPQVEEMVGRLVLRE